MMQDPWAEFRTGPATQPPVAGDPIVAPAPPSERRAEEDQRMQRDQFERSATNQEKVQGRNEFQDTRDTVSSLRQEFRKLPTYERYIVALSAFNSSLTTQPNPQGDQSLITSYAKMLDPTSAVREGEFTVTSQTENTVNQIRARLAKEFGLADGGMLTPDGRKFIRNEMYNLVQNRFRGDYDRDRGDFTGLAQRYGYDPELVVGSDPITSYQAAIDEFAAGQQNVRQSTIRDERPLGNELGFDTFGRDQSYDRVRDLQQRFGITPDSETRLVGVLNANRGNENLTADSLRQIYADAGVPLPGDDDLAALLTDLQSGKVGPTTGIDTRDLRRQYQEGLDTALDQMGENPDSDTAAGVYGTARGVTFGLNDEMTGVGAAIGGLFSGENPVDNYLTYRDLTRRQTERTREASPVISYGSEIAGAMVTGGRAFGNPNTIGQAARAGAAEGALYGFGTGDGLQGSVGNALIGGAGGAVAGAAIQPITSRVTNALASRAGSRQVDNADELAAAATRRDVPLRRMDVDTQAQGRRAALLQNDKTRNTIRDADAEDVAAMERSVANDLGGETTPYAAGQIIADGATRSRQQTRAQASRLYEQAHRQSGDTRIQPTTAIQAIDQNIQELTESGPNQNASAIRYLEGVREDLARDGGLTVRALRDQRSGMRGNIASQNLDKTDLERRMTQVLDAAGDDVAQGLRGSPEALQTFRRADQMWRDQATFKRQILDRLVGRNADNPHSPEQTARAVQNFVRSDFRRARRLIAELDEPERVEVRSLIASSLGRDTGGNFSLARFLTQTGTGSGSLIDDRTARIVFGDDGMRAIRDLRALSQAKVDAASATNRSNTGGIVQRTGRGLRTAMLGMFGFSEIGITGGVAAPAAASFISSLGDQRAARLLTNSDFTRWLRSAPDTSNPRAIDSHFERLRRIATRTPGMTADVDALERTLIGYANDNSAKLAAEPEGGNGNNE
jgi:hypothetical protein